MSETTPSKPNLAERLRAVRVGVRRDLEVTRHVFRREPCYIVRDPVTFQSHRLEPADYEVLVSIGSDRTLGEIFSELCNRELMGPEQEETFYHFVFNLHRLGFLNLPVSDDKLLYRRHVARQRARRTQKLMGFLFLQVPLANPDAFLTRTLPAVRWVFTRSFFLVWLLVVGCAVGVAATRWSDLVAPVNGLLATRNLGVMWITLILLKVCHEFGHAYACKRFGGHVPEMGAYLIVFTPCAYVDATACWGFTSKWHRLVVTLAGMYVEVFIAAIAMFVWALTGPGLLNALAYKIIFLASVVTILFNVNPLMRYDGYYVASDMLEIPNLRQRSKQCLLGLAKRVLLGVRTAAAPLGWRLRAILLSFGAASTGYRVLVLSGLTVMIVYKFSLFGLVLAAFFLGTTLIGIVRRLTGYLWFAQETAPVRVRAVALSALLLFIIPVGLGLLPTPARVNAAGSVSAERETTVRAAVPGYIDRIALERGQLVQEGDLLAELNNLTIAETVAQARAELDASSTRRAAYEADDPARAQEEAQRMRFRETKLADSLTQQADLEVRTTTSGRVAEGLLSSDTGRFLQVGDPVALIVSGDWQVRALLTAEEFASARREIGDAVTFRPTDDPSQTLSGTITRINRVASRNVALPALTHVGGGDIVVDQASGLATEPYFEIVITLDDADGHVRYGMTGVVQLAADPQPMAVNLYRRFMRFTNKLLKN